MRDEYKILGEAYASIYNQPEEQLTVGDSDLMMDIVSRITSSFTFMSPAYNPIQEGTVKFIAYKWYEGKINKALLERTLDRARTHNNKAVETFLEYVMTGFYDDSIKGFVSENILPELGLIEEKKEKHVFTKVEKAAEKAGYSKKVAEKIAGAAKAKANKKK